MNGIHKMRSLLHIEMLLYSVNAICRYQYKNNEINFVDECKPMIKSKEIQSKETHHILLMKVNDR